MTISMYNASVPVFKQMLGGLDGVLARAEAHAGDTVALLSNGAFAGLHGRLLAALSLQSAGSR